MHCAYRTRPTHPFQDAPAAGTLRLLVASDVSVTGDVDARPIPASRGEDRTLELGPGPHQVNLRLGLTVAVTVPARGGPTSQVSLPATALFQQGTKPAVWIVKQDQTLELRAVAVDRFESDRVLVRNGLQQGDRVVTAGVHRLAAGEKVRLMADGAP